MLTEYDLDKIKFATDWPTFEKEVLIYGSGGVKNFKDAALGFEAMIRGSKAIFITCIFQRKITIAEIVIVI